MKRANFFIVGAPKCGTTALSEYLRTHPNAFVSHPKEPYYFAEDFPGLRNIKTARRYARLFRGVTPSHTVCGEASAGYLYSSVAIGNLRRYNADAKLIVMLRNPADMIYALHSQLLFSFDEDQEDFVKAWRLQDRRAKGQCIPRRCRAAEFLQYGGVGRLGDQVERLLSNFPREQVLFVFVDDLLLSMSSEYRRVLEFLELPHDGRKEFPRINENKSHRFAWLGYLWIRKPRILRRPIEALKQQLGASKLICEEGFKSVYTRKSLRPPLANDFRRELMGYFDDDISKLGELTGRDLGHWRVKKTAA